MKYGEFRKLIGNKNIKGPYLFTGEEGLVMEKTIEYIVNTFINPSFKDFNYTHLNSINLELDYFYSSIETLPFMSDKRVVIIDELNVLQTKQNLSDIFFDTLKNTSDETIIIFHDSDQNLKKNTKLYKFFKNINRVVEFDKLNNSELSSFLKKEILKKDKTISEGDLSYFIMLSGYHNRKVEVNLYDVETEMEKLISYSSSEKITRDDINKVTEKANDSDVFNLLEGLANKNSIDSLRYLHDLYDKNESLNSILYMIQRRYRQMYKYLSLYQDMKNELDIKKSIGIPSDYEFKIVSKISRGQDLCELRDNLEKILEIDKKLKSTSQDQLLLMEYLVVDICT
ncbi:MAG: DNA polymerase III subunit delta [Tissierellia bacterium]|nr:DNA polymerase III subunit delta [Tissierellia bacterium]